MKIETEINELIELLQNQLNRAHKTTAHGSEYRAGLAAGLRMGLLHLRELRKKLAKNEKTKHDEPKFQLEVV
jgi:hypothetical protein